MPDATHLSAALRVCTALNAIAGTVWVLFFLERSIWGRSSLSDYGAALGPVVLLFLIPQGALSIWWLKKRRPQPLTTWPRRYLHLSTAFLATTWVASCLPIVFWTGLLSLYLSTRWPINLREGPDTQFARVQFEEHFGFSATGLDDLYCRREWDFGDGNIYRMRFRFRDAATLDNLIERARLVPSEPSNPSGSWLVELESPKWWPGPDFTGYQRVFEATRGRPRLWVDETSRIAYYRSWP
jgi:hypothetical protein